MNKLTKEQLLYNILYHINNHKLDIVNSENKVDRKTKFEIMEEEVKKVIENFIE